MKQMDIATFQLEFENIHGKRNDGDKEYKVEAICNSKFYIKESYGNHVSGLYYLISWKDYLKKKNIWELTLAI